MKAKVNVLAKHPYIFFTPQLDMQHPWESISNHWTGIWNGTMKWKMEWNNEHTKLQLTHVTGTAQSRSNYLVYL